MHRQSSNTPSPPFLLLKQCRCRQGGIATTVIKEAKGTARQGGDCQAGGWVSHRCWDSKAVTQVGRRLATGLIQQNSSDHLNFGFWVLRWPLAKLYCRNSHYSCSCQSIQVIVSQQSEPMKLHLMRKVSQPQLKKGGENFYFWAWI